jgi:hypothetical protein
MITKSELQNAHRSLADDERRRLGDPPTTEELLAYSRGELPYEEEERIAELLAVYPELARTLTATLPTDDPKPGEPGYVSDAELAQRWTMLQDRMHDKRETAPVQSGARVLQFWRFTSGLAAALAVAFGALLWQARSDLGQPRVAAPEMLMPDRSRGGPLEATKVTPLGDSYVIGVPVMTEQHFDNYRLEVIDESSRSLWTSGALRASETNLMIVMPRRFLKPGQYQVILYGIARPAEQRLETYSFRVASNR